MRTRLLLAVLFTGCASTQVPRNATPIVDAATYAVSYDRAWDAVVAALSADPRFVIDVADKSGGVITTKRRAFVGVDAGPGKSDFPKLEDVAYLPSIAAQVLGGGWKDVSHRLSVTVQSSGEQTRVRVTAIVDGNTTSGIHHDLPSKGLIEREVLAKLAAQLGS